MTHAEQTDALAREVAEWRERALAAEAEVANLRRKLKGWQKQRDPMERLRRLGR